MDDNLAITGVDSACRDNVASLRACAWALRGAGAHLAPLDHAATTRPSHQP